MGRITYLPNIGAVKTVEDLANIVSGVFNQMLSEFNGKLSFQQNIRSSGLVTKTFAGTSILTIEHTFRAVPTGFIVVKSTNGEVLFAPQGKAYEWTDQVIYLQATATTTASFYII